MTVGVTGVNEICGKRLVGNLEKPLFGLAQGEFAGYGAAFVVGLDHE
jgi:hypothetical protein